MNLNSSNTRTPSPDLQDIRGKSLLKSSSDNTFNNNKSAASSFIGIYKSYDAVKDDGSPSKCSSCNSSRSVTPLISSANIDSVDTATSGVNVNIRYTRSALYLLRNDMCSRRRPYCALRTELRSLGVWKFDASTETASSNTTGYSDSSYQSGNSSSHNNGHEVGAVVSQTSGSSSSSTMLGSLNSHFQQVRSQRSSAGAVSYLSHSHTHAHHHQQHYSLQKSISSSSSNYLDHRSISSAHLMPAFAKRRIAASGGTVSAVGVPKALTQNMLQGSIGCNPSTSSPEAGTRGNAPLHQEEDKEITGPGYYRHLQHNKQQHGLYEYRQDARGISESRTNYLSPQRNRRGDYERECVVASPVSSAALTHGRHGAVTSSLGYERRIGSGRLLPRDVNNYTDYSTIRGSGSIGNSHLDNKDGNKIQANQLSSDVLMTVNRNSACSGRGILERNSSNAGVVSDIIAGSMERRLYDRRSSTFGSDGKYEQNSQKRHATSTQDMLPAQQPHNRHNRRQQQQSLGSHHGHHNSYHERLEEPEWFSGGPTSQHDTIELRGFDEIENYGSTKSSSAAKNMLRRHNSNNSNTLTVELSGNPLSRPSSNLNLASTTLKTQQLTTYGSGDSETAINVSINNTFQKFASGNGKNIAAVRASGYDTDDSITPVAPLSNSNDIFQDVSCVTDDSDNVSAFLNALKKNEQTQQDGGRNAKALTAEEQQLLNVVDEKLISTDTKKNEFTDFFGSLFPSKNIGHTKPSNVPGNTNEKAGSENQRNHELFDVFFNSDALEHTLLLGGNSHGSDIGNPIGISKSRFSRWFATKTSCENSNQISVAANDTQLSRLDLTEKHLCTKADATQSNTLLEFLQRSKLPTSVLPEGVTPPNVTAIPSVEELEARMRHVDSSRSSSSTTNVKDDAELSLGTLNLKDINLSKTHESQTHGDIAAFKKLLEQLGTGNTQQQFPVHMMLPHTHTHPHCPTGFLHSPPPPSQMSVLLQTGLHSATAVAAGIMCSVPALQKEDTRKLIQQQQPMFRYQQTQPQQSKQIYMQQRMSPQHMPSTVGDIEFTSNILPPQNHLPHSTKITSQMQPLQKRLEAQHMFQSVMRGEISVSFLEQEFVNPNTTPQAREIIATVLREKTLSVTPLTVLNQPSQVTAIVTGTTTSLTQSVTLPHRTNTQQEHSPILPTQAGTFVVPPSNMLLSNAVLMTGANPLPTQQQAIPAVGLPNPRDLQFHTQVIMQNALIKKKLEERQQDAHRKRQLQSHTLLNQLDTQQPKNMKQQPQSQLYVQQHQQQPRQLNSPTHLSFTPTSVLRKMTADKENSAACSMASSGSTNTTNIQQQQQQPLLQPQKQQLPQSIFLNQSQSTNASAVSQPRMILGIGNTTQQQQQQSNISQNSPQHQHQHVSTTQLRNAAQQQQINWPAAHQMLVNQMLQPAVITPMGRPILKGPTNTMSHQQPLPPPPSQQQTPHMTFAAKLEFQQISQQQQRLKNNQTPQHILNHQQPQQIFSPPPTHAVLTQQQHQQLYQQHQQQQRVLALQRQQHLEQQMQQQHHNQQQQMQQQQTNKQQFDAVTRTMGNDNVVQNSTTVTPTSSGAAAAPPIHVTATGVINYQRDGGLSPTSNQLAQWFSPELLAQASAGKLPLLNMNQTLSLEEFERSIQQHSSTTAVHN